jgi:thiol-disulfide isomerase/thioredoxin
VVLSYGSGPAVDTWVRGHSAAVIVAVAIGICAIAALVYALSLRSDNERLKQELTVARQKAARGRGVAIGFGAPEFTLPDLSGAQVGLADLLSRGKPLLLVFMSPWCGPCASLLPRVQQWQHTLSDRMTLALISMGTIEQNEVFAEHGLEDVLIQEGFEVADSFGVTATPSAVFISHEGRVASTVGETEFGIEPLVRLAIRDGVGAMLQEPAA